MINLKNAGPLLIFPLCSQLWAATITWEKSKIELTASIEDSAAEVEFTFTNTGPHPVKIIKTRTSCGCTVASQSLDSPYPPGQQGHIKVIFTFGERTGTHENKITVETAEILPDGSQGKPEIHHLSLVVNIPPAIKIEPGFLYWLPREAKNPKTARVTVADNLDIEVYGIRVGDPALDAKFKTITPKKEYEITITPGEETFKEGSTTLVLVETSLKKRRFVLFVNVFPEESIDGGQSGSQTPIIIPLPTRQ